MVTETTAQPFQSSKTARGLPSSGQSPEWVEPEDGCEGRKQADCGPSGSLSDKDALVNMPCPVQRRKEHLSADRKVALRRNAWRRCGEDSLGFRVAHKHNTE